MAEGLKELFDRWRLEQINDTNYRNNTKKHKGKYISKDSFCVDGFVGENCEYGVSILFVMKESNLMGYKAEENKFWFKDVHKKYRHKIPRRLRKCTEVIGCDYNKCAYMNVNKRGGFGNSDNKVIENYFKDYKGYIFEEIEIIKPQKILIASKELTDIIYEDIKRRFPDIDIYFTEYHPSIVKKNGTYITDDEYKNRMYIL